MPPSAVTTSLPSQTTLVSEDHNDHQVSEKTPQIVPIGGRLHISQWQQLKLKLKEHDPILTALYIALTWLCYSMVGWILIAPASWLIDKSSFHRETLLPFLESMGLFRLTPTIIVTKYQHHTAVHLTHLLPGALWAAIIPFQLHPARRSSKYHRKVHRTFGYIFTGCAFLVALGVGIMFQRNLTFMHSFPQISPVQGGFRPHITIPILLLLALWFLMTIFQAVRMAVQRNYAQHQKWIIRHVASGIWVAAQRFVLIPMYDVVFQLTRHSSYNDVDTSTATVAPEVQRQTFNDAGLIAAFICLCLAEYAIHRISKLRSSGRVRKRTS